MGVCAIGYVFSQTGVCVKLVQTILTVAAASDLTFVLPVLNNQFEENFPNVKVNQVMAASGVLYSQISKGAPYDVFLSADSTLPKKLIDEKYALKDSFTQYAQGTLVLWLSAKTQAYAKQGSELEVLAKTKVGKIAIANPEHAPYGALAKLILENSSVGYEPIKSKFVFGANVAQVAQYAAQGAVDAAFVSKSLVHGVLKNSSGVFEIGKKDESKLNQGAVVLKNCKDEKLCSDYLKFLTSAKQLQTWKTYGF